MAAALTAVTLLTLWFWFLITLAPVAGFVPLGAHVRADRYAYAPLEGVFVGVAWTLADRGSRLARKWLVACAVLALVCCSLLSWTQAHAWSDSLTLWEHTVAVAESGRAHCGLGLALKERGQVSEALRHYREAIRPNPAFALSYYNLGTVFLERGQLEESGQLFREASLRDPRAPRPQVNLGNVLLRQWQTEKAVGHFQKALLLDPHSASTHFNLGRVHLLQGRWTEATAAFRQALTHRPGDPRCHRCLAYALQAT